jgi:hypothetical protein
MLNIPLPIVTAHSNWCELALQSMGHREVFAHVGRNVTVHAPNGQNVPILVTGTFGGNDFIHSLLGTCLIWLRRGPCNNR